ncbi:MAG: hypothetical protein ACKOWF_17630 [Chloroflexota bacterium]
MVWPSPVRALCTSSGEKAATAAMPQAAALPALARSSQASPSMPTPASAPGMRKVASVTPNRK